MDKFRILVILFCFLFITPTCYVSAESETPEGVYSDNVPYVYDLEFIMHANGGEDRFAGDFFNLNKTINAFEFIVPIVDGIDYQDYYVVFDFTLKSQLDDGSITTHSYMEKIDIAEDYSPGWLDSLFITLGWKDNAYNVYFNFGKLVSNSPDLIKIEKYVANASDLVPVLTYDYNTVVSRIDVYFLHKSTNEYGMIQRFDLTWHEDFYYSCCVSINYALFKPDTDEVLESGNLSDTTGIYGFDSSGDNVLHEAKGVMSQIAAVVTEVPLVLLEIVLGIKSFIFSFSDLLGAVFPFLPGIFIDVLGFFIIFVVLLGLYKIVKGFF